MLNIKEKTASWPFSCFKGVGFLSSNKQYKKLGGFYALYMCYKYYNKKKLRPSFTNWEFFCILTQGPL